MLFQAIVLAAISAELVKAGTMESYLIEIAKECGQNNPITKTDITMLHKGEVPNSIFVHCFIACMLKTMGIIGEDSMIDQEATVKNMKKRYSSDAVTLEKALKISEFCGKEANAATISTDDIACGRAAVTFMCLRDNADKFGVAILDF